MAGIKVGNVDIQFGKDFDQAKANQLVQTLQQVVGAVNQLANQASTPATPTTPVSQVLATQAALGKYLTVSGLEAGQVLVALTPTTAHFGFLAFGQMAQTDPGTFESPTNGSVISFVDGYWSASPNSFGLSSPGTDAALFWDATANGGAGGLAWALPGSGIKFAPGSIAVNTSQLVHGQLQGLLADDHPQYALVGTVPELAVANTFTALQTFELGAVLGGDLDLTGNIEQVGLEGVEQRIRNTDDQPNEGTWREHVEPGQWMFAAVNDPETDGSPGSDAEDWLYVQRIGDIVDTVGVEASFFRFNGFDVCVGDPIPGSPFFDVIVANQRYRLLTTAVALGGVPGSGTVTSVGFSSPLGTVTASGGPITGVGTLHVDLPAMGGITPGSYTNINATVDAYGRLTAVANGTGGGGSGTVTSVGLSTTSGFLTLSGTNPVTGAGTIGVDISSSAQAMLTAVANAAATALQPITGLAGSYTSANLTINSSGQITAAANGSGGGSQPFNVTPDTHGTGAPAFVANDEFEGATLDTAGTRFTGALPWTVFNTASIPQTITLNQGSAILENTDTTADLAGFYQTIAAGSAWRYRAKWTYQYPSGTTSAGLLLRESATGKLIIAGILCNSSPSLWMAWYAAYNAGSQTGFVGFSGWSLNALTYPNTPAQINDLYYELELLSGSIYFRFSPTGLDGTFVTVGSVVVTTAFTTAPDGIGFVTLNQTGVALFLMPDWFRRAA